MRGPPDLRKLAAKRVFDLACALPGLVLLAPVMALVALAIRLDSSGPVLFRQTRVGLHGRPFAILKFRSMTHARSDQGAKLTVAGDVRVTRVGAFLRKSKLDETPQLLNVVAGQMSIVGPRPEVPDYMALYDAREREIMTSVRPGVTDIACVLLRDESEILARAKDPVETYRRELMPLKARLCALYTSHMSVALDLRIVLATLQAIATRRPPRWLDELARDDAQRIVAPQAPGLAPEGTAQ